MKDERPAEDFTTHISQRSALVTRAGDRGKVKRSQGPGLSWACTGTARHIGTGLMEKSK